MSEHENEEEQILNVYSKIRETIPQTLLALIPRHPERFNKVANLW